MTKNWFFQADFFNLHNQYKLLKSTEKVEKKRDKVLSGEANIKVIED